MTANAEEVEVEKRAVVKEVIVIRKHAVVENQTVEADVRRERVDVDRNAAADVDTVRSADTTPGTYGTGGTMGDIDTSPGATDPRR